MKRVLISFAAFILLGSAMLTAQSPALHNWPVPGTPRNITPMADITNPMPFIAVTPCRIVDTFSFPAGPYGPPALVARASRNFTLTGQCGIPGSATVISANFTVFNQAGGNGDIRVWPAGGTAPLVSTLNWGPNTGPIANAALVPLSGSGAISVQNDAFTTVDLIIDVNGYFVDIDFGETALGEFFGIAGSYAGGGVIFARNSNVATGSVSIRGAYWVAGTDGAGVWGEQTSATGRNFGVLGTSNSATSGSAGVRAISNAGTGGVYGVHASVVSGNTNNGTAAVLGTVGTAVVDSAGPSGVHGSSGATGVGYGVLGSGRYVATSGRLFSAANAFLAEGVLGYTTGAANYGVYSFGNFAASGTKTFIEPHPSDPTKVIRYVALEGPEAGTYFRGTAQTRAGRAIIQVPEDFRMVTSEEGLTVQLTPNGELAMMAVIDKGLDYIVVKSSKDVSFDYEVKGVRRAFRDWSPIADGTEFAPRSADERMPGYLTDEAKQRLIANGTYNEDGSVNLETAERVGWAQQWRERDAERAAAAAAAVAPVTSEQDGYDPADVARAIENP